MAAGLFGLLAEFDTPEALEVAAKAARDRGYRKMEAFTPFPVEGLAEAVGHPRSRLSALVFWIGLSGGAAGFLFQCWSQAVDYPWIIGGRPMVSWPSFIPVTFECVILSAALAAAIGMIVLNGLPLFYHALFNNDRFERVTTDGFFLCIEASDPLFDRQKTEKELSGWQARGVSEVAE
jgi:hypothetical protein